MRIVENELAQVSEARAYQLDDVLILQLAGTRPTACHDVSIERALTDVEPPGFVARMSINPVARCMAVETSFDAVAAFRVGAPREQVTVWHDGDALTVAVHQLQTSTRVVPEAVGGLFGDLQEREPVESVGYSSSWDLSEAMHDAISRLPRGEIDNIPDWLHEYTVVSVGAEIGGIAGFNRMRVTVRR